MPPNRTNKLSFAQLGDLLQNAWEQGYIESKVHTDILNGMIPIGYLRDKLRLAIERSDEEGYLNVTQLPEDYYSERQENSGDFRKAA